MQNFSSFSNWRLYCIFQIPFEIFSAVWKEVGLKGTQHFKENTFCQTHVDPPSWNCVMWTPADHNNTKRRLFSSHVSIMCPLATLREFEKLSLEALDADNIQGFWKHGRAISRRKKRSSDCLRISGWHDNVFLRTEPNQIPYTTLYTSSKQLHSACNDVKSVETTRAFIYSSDLHISPRICTWFLLYISLFCWCFCCCCGCCCYCYCFCCSLLSLFLFLFSLLLVSVVCVHACLSKCLSPFTPAQRPVWVFFHWS